MVTAGNRPVPASVLALPWIAWAALRATGSERGFPLVPAISFTPYAAATSVLPLAAAVHARSRTATVLAGTAAAVLAGAVMAGPVMAGAVVSRHRVPAPVPDGPRVRIATVSLRRGLVRAAPVVDLVRRFEVDVLSVQELTPGAERSLRAAGIGRLLPWAHVLAARPGSVPSASGAVWTRLPAVAAGAVPGTYEQPKALIEPPGALPFELTAVHSAPPARSPRSVAQWTTDLAALPPPDGVPLRVLAGDFNATPDHAALRAVLRRGWTDAARQAGLGRSWTWRPLRLPWPRLTLDHVLVDTRIAVAGVQFVRVAGSDHRALVVDLVLPAG